MDAVANRVRRVATGWETQLTVAVDGVLSPVTIFELCEAFFALDPHGVSGHATGGPGTRLRVRTEVLAGTWEALVTGQADLAIGVGAQSASAPLPGIDMAVLGPMKFVFAVAPHHPLASATAPITDAQLLQHRAVAVADSAQRMSPLTVNLLAGQDVFTVSSSEAKIEALLRCLGCGFVPETLARCHIEAGLLVVKPVERPQVEASMCYAWRVGTNSSKGRRAPLGLALQWWLGQLESPTTRRALLERHRGPPLT
jgi:DNA-binding transcriptional LysR family regulator